ncbi:porin [Litoreibacter albidus]|uniref:Porin domain-containing protein n=1 Tax=Litoreibacter albidus TaxID=670155 RepID=A0A1H2RLD5_9RHOB|nr:porin [Litoreibacter albidus]SDW20266.1 hypothetical protein SAMN04488001_0546 [Litoreibacter albidus]
MKSSIHALAALALCATIQPAAAFELTGGSVDLGYSAFADDTDFSKLSLQGSVEAAFTRNFGAQLDLSYHDFNFVNDSGSNMTLHALYHVNEVASLGLFYGRDSDGSTDIDFYGIEGGYEFNNFDAEMYLATGEEAGISGNMFGLEGRYAINEKTGLGGSIDRVNFDGGVDATRIGVKVDHDLTETFNLNAEVGTARLSVPGLSGTETFVGIGAQFKFGAERGTTFGKRGLLDLIPGL